MNATLLTGGAADIRAEGNGPGNSRKIGVFIFRGPEALVVVKRVL
ncbi:MAG TPA: hypothetical protein PLZ16_14615 [Gammaproteobacteria bacterium]|nr:hypothetical protein [Gammaproteobacteria bacterium]